MVGKIRPRKIIMPSELTGKKRRRLSGPVITYKLSQLLPGGGFDSLQEVLKGGKEEMVSPESFANMSNKKQQAVLLDLVREGKSDVEIGEMLDMSQWQIRNLRYKLGIKKDRGGNVQLEPLVETKSDSTGALVDLGPLDEKEEEQTHGLVLRVSGTYSATETAQRLQALASLVMIDADNMQYSLNIRLQETSPSQSETSAAAKTDDGSEDSSSKESQEDESESSARVS